MSYKPLGLYKSGIIKSINGFGFNSLKRIDEEEIHSPTIIYPSTTETSFPTGEFYASVTMGSLIYLMGQNNIWVYDTKNNTIEKVCSCLSNATSRGCATVGNKIYSFGGLVQGVTYLNWSSDSIWVFDAETKSTQNIGTLPIKLEGIGTSSVGKKIYLFGGRFNPELTIGRPVAYKDIYEFDTDTNSLTKLEVSLPFVLYNTKAVTVGKKIYLFGGTEFYYSSDSYDIYNYHDIIQVFDTVTKTIETLSIKVPTVTLKDNYIQCTDFLSDMALISIGSKIYLIGGLVSIYGTNTIYSLDTVSNTFEKLFTTLPLESQSQYAVNHEGFIYLFGGYADPFYGDVEGSINCCIKITLENNKN